MTTTSRLDLELADALGLTQSVRAAATDAAERVSGGKLRRRLEQIDAELAPLQESINELVVADPERRSRLTARSARLRDTADAVREDEATDAIDALQRLAAESAHALAQWQVVRRLAKAGGRKDARRLAKQAMPLAERHLQVALKCVDRAAKREAAAA